MGFIFTVHQRSRLPVCFMIASIVYMKLSVSRLNRLVSYVYERERDMISLIGAIISSLMNERCGEQASKRVTTAVAAEAVTMRVR